MFNIELDARWLPNPITAAELRTEVKEWKAPTKPPAPDLASAELPSDALRSTRGFCASRPVWSAARFLNERTDLARCSKYNRCTVAHHAGAHDDGLSIGWAVFAGIRL